MLTSFTQVKAESLGRAYGGGVLKFELKDARSLPCCPATPIGSTVFTRLDAALRDNALELAMDLADEAILPHFFGSRWKRVQSEMREELAGLRARRAMKRGSRQIETFKQLAGTFSYRGADEATLRRQ